MKQLVTFSSWRVVQEPALGELDPVSPAQIVQAIDRYSGQFVACFGLVMAAFLDSLKQRQLSTAAPPRRRYSPNLALSTKQYGL
jgi:hypothetical protein